MGGFTASILVNSNLLPALAVDGALRKAAGETIRRTAGRILDASKQAAPVDTGRLRDSGHIEEIDQLNVDVVYDAADDNDKHYAVYPELGTVNQAAQPYLTPAYEAHKDSITDLRLG